MRLVEICVLALFGASTALGACGGDDDSKAGSGGGGGSGAAATGGSGSTSDPCDPSGSSDNNCPDLATCATTKCDTEYQQCLGAGYKTADFTGGTCEPLMTCAVACKTGTTCDETCAKKCVPTATCTDCLVKTVSPCIQTNCSAEVQKCAGTGGGTGTGGAGGGKTCADLQACCASLSGSDQTTCNSLYDGVKAGGDAGCNVAIQAYVTSGKC